MMKVCRVGIPILGRCKTMIDESLNEQNIFEQKWLDKEEF